MAKVDVVVPNHQYGRYLRECVTSVLRQGISDLRVLIIDNASTDDSLAVARQLSAEDGRIDVLARPCNLGPHASWNEGIEWARADYLVILAADDLLTDGAIGRAITALDSHPSAGFAMGRDVKLTDGDAHPIVDIFNAQAEWTIVPGARFIEVRCREPHRGYCPGSMVVRTAVQKRAGHYRAELAHTDDLEMLLRLAMLGDVAVTNAFQGVRREHGNNRTNQFWTDRLPDFIEREAAFDSFFRHEGSPMPDARRLNVLARRRIADFAYWTAMSRFVRGDRQVAYNLFKFAIARFPSMAVIPPIGFMLRMDYLQWRQFVGILMKLGRFAPSASRI